jgi:hypothetical protein
MEKRKHEDIRGRHCRQIIGSHAMMRRVTSLQVPAGLIAKNTSQPVILSGVRELKCTKLKIGKKCGRFA